MANELIHSKFHIFIIGIEQGNFMGVRHQNQVYTWQISSRLMALDVLVRPMGQFFCLIMDVLLRENEDVKQHFTMAFSILVVYFPDTLD